MAVKSGALCCIDIGYYHLLMPLSDGLKVMQLLSGAAKVERTYAGNGKTKYSIDDEEEIGINLTAVKAEDVIGKRVQPASKRPRKALSPPQLKLEHGQDWKL